MKKNIYEIKTYFEDWGTMVTRVESYTIKTISFEIACLCLYLLPRTGVLNTPFVAVDTNNKESSRKKSLRRWFRRKFGRDIETSLAMNKDAVQNALLTILPGSKTDRERFELCLKYVPAEKKAEFISKWRMANVTAMQYTKPLLSDFCSYGIPEPEEDIMQIALDSAMRLGKEA